MTISDAMDGWTPRPRESSRRVDPWAVGAFAALIDTPAPPALDEGAPLPPMWHWLVLLEHPAQSAIGPDGHPAHGHFLPPIPDRRRMFAGGRLRLHAPIPLGGQLDCRSTVADVRIKQGRSGEMAFVSVRHDLSVDGVLAATEEQDIVYRSEPDGTARPSVGRPAAADTMVTPTWETGVDADPVLLFRFSALTYNGHRIHYDLPYATGVESYPGLVVHGPLLALLALELPRVQAPHRLTAFDYRLVRPSFAPARITATAVAHGANWELAAGTEHAVPSLTATATLDEESDR